MNWKYEAIEKLKGYDARKRSLASIPEEINRLESKFGAIRSASADGTPVQGGGSGREDALLSNLVHREELKSQFEQAKLWCSVVERSMECLTDEERTVLDRFYIHPARGNVDRLCEELGIEVAAVYRRRNDALRKLTLAMYGVDVY